MGSRVGVGERKFCGCRDQSDSKEVSLRRGVSLAATSELDEMLRPGSLERTHEVALESEEAEGSRPTAERGMGREAGFQQGGQH